MKINGGRVILKLTDKKDIGAVWTEPSEENVSARKLYSRCGMVGKERPMDMDQEESYWELSREEWKLKKN